MTSTPSFYPTLALGNPLAHRRRQFGMFRRFRGASRRAVPRRLHQSVARANERANVLVFLFQLRSPGFVCAAVVHSLGVPPPKVVYSDSTLLPFDVRLRCGVVSVKTLSGPPWRQKPLGWFSHRRPACPSSSSNQAVRQGGLPILFGGLVCRWRWRYLLTEWENDRKRNFFLTSFRIRSILRVDKALPGDTLSDVSRSLRD